MNARVRRLRRRRQAGFGLLEAMVTIGIVSASLVTLIGALATAEHSAGSDSRGTQLQTALQTLAGELRNSVPYRPCSNSGGFYRNQLNNQPQWKVSGFTVTSVGLERPGGNMPQLNNTSCNDVGLQRLTITARAVNGQATGSIEVWKQASTRATAAPTPSPVPTP